MPDQPNIVDQIMQEHQKKVLDADEKYSKLVVRLDDLEFAGLYTAVMKERNKRMERILLTNPIVRKMAIDDLAKRLKEDE